MKNCRLDIRINQELGDRINVHWRERLRPSPDDNQKQIHFKSKVEYIEFVLRNTSNMGNKWWFLFANMFNPLDKE